MDLKSEYYGILFVSPALKWLNYQDRHWVSLLFSQQSTRNPTQLTFSTSKPIFIHPHQADRRIKGRWCSPFDRKVSLISSEKQENWVNNVSLHFLLNQGDLWDVSLRCARVLLFCRVSQRCTEKRSLRISPSYLDGEAQLCLPQFQRRRAGTRHVEWVCRLWAACQGKVRVPILHPDLSDQLRHVFCQCIAVQRNRERIVLIAVIATLPRTPNAPFLKRCGSS